MIISVSKCSIQESPEDTNLQRNVSLESANKTTNTPDAVPECFFTSTSTFPVPQRFENPETHLILNRKQMQTGLVL